MSVFLIAGGSGFIGSALRELLTADGHEVRSLVRRPAASPDELPWNPAKGVLPPAHLAGVDVLVNLAGASISRLPWTYARRRLILHSRIDATRTLTTAMSLSRERPKVFLSGSATGIYGDRPGERLDEGSAPGASFLARVAATWEAAARAAPRDVRVVHLRTGLVLGRGGGALAPLVPLTRFGLGARLGTGRQRWPWIALRDEVRAIAHLADADVAGPANLTSPAHDTAAEVTRALARALGRPQALALPAGLLHATLGPAADDLLLPDQEVEPGVLLASGFRFAAPTLQEALADVVAA